MLRTKCIFKEKELEDGLRISIMSRHTLNDGKTPDPRLLEPGVFDRHRVELAPHPKIVGMWYKKRISWEDFTLAYFMKLHEPVESRSVDELVVLARKQDVTVMCVEDTPEHCHRGLLAQRCGMIDPGLEIRHVV